MSPLPSVRDVGQASSQRVRRQSTLCCKKVVDFSQLVRTQSLRLIKNKLNRQAKLNSADNTDYVPGWNSTCETVVAFCSIPTTRQKGACNSGKIWTTIRQKRFKTYRMLKNETIPRSTPSLDERAKNANTIKLITRNKKTTPCVGPILDQNARRLDGSISPDPKKGSKRGPLPSTTRAPFFEPETIPNWSHIPPGPRGGLRVCRGTPRQAQV